MQGRTTIAIAHRLSTVRQADLVVVLENGKVIEQGSHDDLVSRRSAYAEMYRLQHGGANQSVLEPALS